MFKSKKVQKKLADNSKLLRQWKRWHREQLDEVLAGPHAVIATQVMPFLETMTPASGAALLALMRGYCWENVDPNTKFILLHEINDAITRMREKHGMAPIDDPLPGEKVNAFLALCEMLRQSNFRK
jgi:hypothetical protein